MLTVATASGTSVIPLAEEVDFACRPGRDGFAARKEFENFYETGAESWTVKMDFSSAEGADELRLNLYPTDPGISSSRAISQVIALRENPCLLLERGEGSWFTALGGTFIDRSAFTVEFGCDVVSRAEQP